MIHCDNTFKLSIILTFTSLYFISELIVGSWINALSLVADSFHMLSDVLSIIVGIVAINVAVLPKSHNNTFGWQRAEVFGSLINCISLLTLNFTIFVSAVQRFILPKPVSDPMLMLIVGGGGIAINFIGLLLLNPLSSSHGHSHGGYNDNKHKNVSKSKKVKETFETSPVNEEYIRNSPDDEEANVVKFYMEMKSNPLVRQYSSEFSSEFVRDPEHSMNIRAIFLHIFADFIGSLIVCTSALIIMYCPGNTNHPGGKYKLYIDPILSLLLIVIITVPTIPLLGQASLILLQSVPKEINIKQLNDELNDINNVMSVHDLHVWRLRPSVIIGTVHLKVHSIDQYVQLSKRVKRIFHHYNIHCTTIQPEFNEAVDEVLSERSEKCELVCVSDACLQNECCPEEKSPI